MTDCVVGYPGKTPDTVILVSYDGNGIERERRITKLRRVTRELVERMLAGLL